MRFPNTLGSGGIPGDTELAPGGAGGGAVVINVTNVWPHHEM